jgi:hypothetical protein
MNISQWQHYLLQEMEEDLSPKQQKIAKLDPPADKIDAGDFKALRGGAKIDETQGELKLGVKYDYKGDSGFISTGGSQDPKNWKFLGDKQKYPYLSVKADLVPAQKQPGKYDGAFDLGMGKGHHIDEQGMDHEVSMANNSLESIIKAAMELKVKLGDNEKDIPAWIQDHITNAANFISQAAENYHEYGEEDLEDTSLSSLMENKTNDKEASKVEKALSAIKTGSRAKMILDDGKTITMERIGTSKSGEPTFKHVDKDGELKGSASAVSASHIKSVKPINK